MKKKFLAVLLAGVMALSLSACSSKNNTTGSNDAVQGENTENKNNGKEQLIVGTEPGFAPYEYMEGNDVVGIDMDIVKAIADDMGRELVIKKMDFDGALMAVQSGKVDLVAAGVSVNEERKQVMDFSDNYVDSTEVVVVDKEKPTVKDVDDLDGKIIGVQQGNIADFWVEENLKPSNIKRYTKFVQAGEDLRNGKIDCIVMDKYPAEELVETSNNTLKILDGTLFEDKYAIAVKKGNTELLNQINMTIERLQAEGKIEEFTANHTAKK